MARHPIVIECRARPHTGVVCGGCVARVRTRQMGDLAGVVQDVGDDGIRLHPFGWGEAVRFGFKELLAVEVVTLSHADLTVIRTRQAKLYEMGADDA